MKTNRHHIATLAAVFTGAVVTMVACQKTGYPDPSPVTTPANTSSKVLFVNATDAPALTTLIENTPAGSSLAPGAASTYLPIATNSSQIRVKGAGGVLGAANLDLTAKQTFLVNTSYTVFITDTINRPQIKNALGAITDNGGIRFVTVTDTLSAPAAGTAKVRYFNMAPDVSSASARLTNTTSSSAVTLANRAYRNAAGTNLRYTSIPAGAYVTQVYSGTSISATATPIVSTTLTVADGKIYTIYTRGLNRTKTVSVGTVQHN